MSHLRCHDLRRLLVYIYIHVLKFLPNEGTTEMVEAVEPKHSPHSKAVHTMPKISTSSPVQQHAMMGTGTQHSLFVGVELLRTSSVLCLQFFGKDNVSML